LDKLLQEEFSKCGKVTSTLVKFDEKTKKPFAFVCFENSEAAKLAMETYNNK
jgi:RNA recognition motif-containing protein